MYLLQGSTAAYVTEIVTRKTVLSKKYH